ncbi:MAG: VOC family protein [Rhizobiales bacterium]|nr:VOC family protein [Hyphomicrobiales bacterium]
MAVRRIVANIAARDLSATRAFYGEIFGLDLVMDHGWIATYGAPTQMSVQISIATEGGSGTPVPDISIEVDDVTAVLECLKQKGIAIAYGPVDEPWGVRRFFVRDPFGKLINVLSHI